MLESDDDALREVVAVPLGLIETEGDGVISPDELAGPLNDLAPDVVTEVEKVAETVDDGETVLDPDCEMVRVLHGEAV